MAVTALLYAIKSNTVAALILSTHLNLCSSTLFPMQIVYQLA